MTAMFPSSLRSPAAGVRLFSRSIRVWNEADAQLAQQRHQLGLRVTRPQGVLGLERDDRLHGVGSADRGRAGLGQADVSDLALGDQLGQGADGVLDGDLRIDPVLVVKVGALESVAVIPYRRVGARSPRASAAERRTSSSVNAAKTKGRAWTASRTCSSVSPSSANRRRSTENWLFSAP